MDEITSLDKTKRQTINPLMDELNKQVEPLLKDAVNEFGEPLSLSFRLYNQIRFYEEFGKLRLGTSVANKETLAKQFGVSIKQIEGAFNNLTNIKKLGKWVEHTEPIFRNVKRTWMSNIRLERGVNSNAIRAELLWDKSRTLTPLELGSEVAPLSESKKKVSESKTLLRNGLKAEDYGIATINDLFNYWQEKTGLPIVSRIKQNRFACSNLLKKHGADGVRRLVDGVAQTQSDKYAPRISDFTQLQSKLGDLLLWGKKQSTKSKGVKIK